MAYTSEIDKLERRHRENPEGRTFAPLADAYRKAGDVARALEILKTGLQFHPDYLSASIVLGRCHLDLADLPSAESAFQRVLDLDKENVIAIKALADITERLSRFDESEHWLNYLLSIDGSNEDARVQLQRLAALREQEANMSMPDLGQPSADDGTMDAQVAEALVSDHSSALETEAGQTPGMDSAGHDTPDEPEHEPAPAMGFEPTVPREAESTEVVEVIRLAETLPVEGMDSSYQPSGENEPSPEKPREDDRETRADAGLDLEREPEEVVSADVIHLDVGVERHEEIVLRPSSTSEYQVPSDAELLAGSRPSGGFAPRVEESQPAGSAHEEEPEAGVTSEELWQSHPEDATTGAEAMISPDLDEPAPDAAMAAGEEDPTLKSTEAWGAPTPSDASPLSEDAAVRDELPESAASVDDTFEDSDEFGELTDAPVEEDEEDREDPARVSAQADEGYPLDEEEDDPGLRDSGSAPVVTETIADLYAQQGHFVEALVVYRQLLLKSPDDTRLQEKIARLDTAGSPGKKSRGFAAAETGGQSVRNYFGDLLSTRLNDSTNGGAEETAETSLPDEGENAETGFMEEAFRTDGDVPVSGEPTRPASGPLSLSAIFGEDSSPVPPVVAGPETPSAAPAASSSFDEFFGERPAAPASTTRTRSVRVDADQDDLDQFHKWLKGLKR